MKKLSGLYKKDTENKIWIREGYQGIPYNDGDDVENRIKEILQRCKNVDVYSKELKEHCINWPQTYHFSPERSNILRPFGEQVSSKDVLEIGGGCGAISRYLGECGANLLTLEGSIRRASIARERTRDLENVTIVADSFEEFEIEEKFDFVTLIGVLEYANVFTGDENPIKYMLDKAKSFLKPDGKLIIAIENRLGLKYFAGAGEDHVGTPMYGIEGRYKSTEAITFGKVELKNHLSDSGFESVEFLAPFPDYKFPSFILTERAVALSRFDSKIFPALSSRRDALLPRITNFNIERVWENIDRNGLTLDLSNSFLCIGCLEPTTQNYDSPIAYSYSTNREKIYCKERRFFSNEKEDILTTVTFPFHDGKEKIEGSVVDLVTDEDPEYKNGDLLILDFMKIVTDSNLSKDNLALFFKKYLRIIGLETGIPYDQMSVDTLLPGELLDAIPQNIMVSESGEYSIIDREWVYKSDLELGYLVFRSLISIVNIITKMGKPEESNLRTLRDFLFYCFDVIGLSIGEDKYNSYVLREEKLRQSVTGCSTFNFSDSVQLVFKNANDIVLENSEYENHSFLETKLNYELEIESYKTKIDELNNEREFLHKSIESIENSLSWKVTVPLRKIKSFIFNK